MITPSFDVFARSWTQGKNQTLSTRLVSDTETPVSTMMKLGKDTPYRFLLESIEGGSVRGRYSIVGRDPDLIWRCDQNGQCSINRQGIEAPHDFVNVDDAPLDSLRKLLDECIMDDPNLPQPMSGGLFGYLGYDMARYMEKLPPARPATVDVPDAVLFRPTLLAIFDQIDNVFTLVAPAWFDATQTAEQAYALAQKRLEAALRDLRAPLSPSHCPAPLDDTPYQPAVITPHMTESDFVRMVEASKEYIRAGDIFQVVLSQKFTMDFAAEPFALYRTVRRVEPSPFMFFFDMNGFSLVGASPEILVRVRDNIITIRPIAGTRPRNQGNRSDQELRDDLLSDPKELAEHLMLLDLGRNDVGRFAKTGTVNVTARNTVEYYRHVMHIVSNVEGALDTRYTPLDALMGGFPAGTVSGAPKVRAMEIIHELEPERRGPYAGCIGYLGANGTMDTCIAIRTGIIKDGKLTMQAGAGIVYDSDPVAEHRECVAKARGILRAAEETLRSR